MVTPEEDPELGDLSVTKSCWAVLRSCGRRWDSSHSSATAQSVMCSPAKRTGACGLVRRFMFKDSLQCARPQENRGPGQVFLRLGK